MWKYLMRNTGKIALAAGGAALLAFGVSNLPIVLLSAAALNGVYIARAALAVASAGFGLIYIGQNNPENEPQPAPEEPVEDDVEDAEPAREEEEEENNVNFDLPGEYNQAGLTNKKVAEVEVELASLKISLQQIKDQRAQDVQNTARALRDIRDEFSGVRAVNNQPAAAPAPAANQESRPHSRQVPLGGNRHGIFQSPSSLSLASVPAAEAANQESMGADQLPKIRRRGNPHGPKLR